MSDHPLSPQRTSAGPFENKKSIAPERRNRGPLSIVLGKKITPAIDDCDVKNERGCKLLNSKRETTTLELDRIRNDDYFPQGEEYEDEIGVDYGQLQRDIPSRRSGRDEEMDTQSRSSSQANATLKPGRLPLKNTLTKDVDEQPTL